GQPAHFGAEVVARAAHVDVHEVLAGLVFLRAFVRMTVGTGRQAVALVEAVYRQTNVTTLADPGATEGPGPGAAANVGDVALGIARLVIGCVFPVPVIFVVVMVMVMVMVVIVIVIMRFCTIRQPVAVDGGAGNVQVVPLALQGIDVPDQGAGGKVAAAH